MSCLFNSSIKIFNTDPMDNSSIWPHSVEICITRVPIRKRDGYSVDFMKNLANKLKNSMAPNGIVFLICYAPMECKFRPFEIGSEMAKVGFNHIDNIVIEKTWLPGKRSENNLVNSHDYVLFFCNGDVWKIDRSPIKQYLMLDDSTSCVGNTWLVETGSLDESCSDDLATLLIRMSDLLPGSSVFDPFMGNSAILKACLTMGHSLIGFETDKRKTKQYQKIVDDFKRKEQDAIREVQD